MAHNNTHSLSMEYDPNRYKGISLSPVSVHIYQSHRWVQAQPAYSSFVNNSDEVLAWLEDPNSSSRIIISGEHEYSVGYGTYGRSSSKNTKHIYYDIKRTKTILVKDSSCDTGFFVLSSFPSLD